MKIRWRVLLVSGLLVVALVGALASTAIARQPEQPTLAAAAAKTTFPGLAAPADSTHLDGLDDASPLAGTISQVPGPFDDRLRFDALSFDGAAASGAVTVTSDVSELLELEVVAGFYDAEGTFLGVGNFVHHATGQAHAHASAPEQAEKFSIAVPGEFAGQAASAAVGVAVLVNE